MVVGKRNCKHIRQSKGSKFTMKKKLAAAEAVLVVLLRKMLNLHFLFKQNQMWCLLIVLLLPCRFRCTKWHKGPEVPMYVRGAQRSERQRKSGNSTSQAKNKINK